MANRLFTIATIVSTALVAAVFVLSMIGVENQPSRHRLSIGPLFHISVGKLRGFPRLFVFNDSEGPYRGSITHLSGSPTPWDKKIAFGETGGIYYRYFHWKTGGSLWTLSVSLLYPGAIFAILPAVYGLRLWRQRNRSATSAATS